MNLDPQFRAVTISSIIAQACRQTSPGLRLPADGSTQPSNVTRPIESAELGGSGCFLRPRAIRIYRSH
ncbi:hypothetical protein DSO57_1010750 [Entomophthora muscae]|uniref:Uncharacterized protein n=1 Tax=Entomophthora muscae TaxID=34485 RepID=A0ACC2TH11_9FUNG|nr:hypothetical protein DSO57_1010750 [Entomophthora muscae]